MVALSVSISAKISPSSTSSPTFFNQVATVPSSMVSLRRGIVTTITPSGSSVLELASKSTSEISDLVSSTSLITSNFSTSTLSFNRLEISSPSSPIIAKSVSTLAVSPSGIPICNNVPSLKDSNSIVALSVSISAKISPSSILSPTFFNQEATVPSSIVSLKRGMLITSAIAYLIL